MQLTWPQAIGRRLARHHQLVPAPAQDLVQVASDICGAHAQVGASAELMLGMRVQGISRQDVRAALSQRRTLVRTVGLRGTLHLIPAGEVPVWMAANRPFSVLLACGRVAGVLGAAAKGKRLLVRVEAQRALHRRQRAAVDAQAEHRPDSRARLRVRARRGRSRPARSSPAPPPAP